MGLSGLRGTGKTTLLWHTAEYIYENINTEIYFFNVEALQSFDIRIFDIFSHLRYQENYAFKPIILLFDEVHADPEWSKSLKIIYDELNLAFVVATGSSALLLQTTADLATRMLIKHIFPLQFSEFIEIKTYTKSTINTIELKEKLREYLFFSKDINEAKKGLLQLTNRIKQYYETIENETEKIEQYIQFQNIARFIFYENYSDISEELKGLYRRVIHEDIPKISKNVDSLNAEKLLIRLAASDEINIQSLSQTIGISKKEIAETIDILAKAELLNVLVPFGGIDSKLNKTKKAFFMSPSIRHALLSQLFYTKLKNDFLPKLYEDLVVMYLKRLFSDAIVSFSSYTQEKNPDFIIETRDQPILLEVGINKKSEKQITKSRIKYRYGIIINTKIEELTIAGNIISIPLKWFLLI